ncbi:hypothetical protein EV189_0170 [Motilibacter rhizosphaerae]|uniref:Uncharacterized protein n=1 Tax=Motilibacter rhizosphaerae TaxID=598652 RepID=A0A4Q7NVF0_9ACTN|nr:hypothetical protein [Motilibacter rhizosphaerae]RZS90940.1 hypothetical protein EV189_0170 [Motilibacter rhizosphaerae]
MLSVIVYGRNDSYGYRLEKRAALALNSWGEMLDPARGDEIVFCDYNTPDELPTFPETIADTLTPVTRELLQVVRVRPRHHARWAERTHLVALEPQGRNAALRRTNPANRWVLSTNTDMVFLVEGGRLADRLETLEDGFYQLPRFELPESLWSEWERSDPQGFHAELARLAGPLGLDRVLLSPDCVVDGPGDFQLALREDLFAIAGFDEAMLNGWHVDGNLQLRLDLHRREKTRLLPLPVRGYHCDHTLAPTAMHAGAAVHNSWQQFLTRVQTADLHGQQPHWGLGDVELEHFSLRSRAGRIARLTESAARAAVSVEGARLPSDQVAEYGTEQWVDAPVELLVAHATSLFAAFEAGASIAWSGSSPDVLLPLRAVLAGEGRTGTWYLDSDCDLVTRCPELLDAPDVELCDITSLEQLRPDVVVVESVLPATVAPGGEREREDRMAQAQRTLRHTALTGETCPGWDPMVIAVGAGGTALQELVDRLFVTASAPMGTGIRLGRVRRAAPTGTSFKDLALRVTRAVGAAAPLRAGEFAHLVDATRDAAQGRPSDLQASELPWVRALCADAAAPDYLGVTRASLDALLRQLPELAAEPVAEPGALRQPDGGDLRDELWRSTARAVIDEVPPSIVGRENEWLLPTLVQELRASAGRRPRVALVSNSPEILAAYLGPWCEQLVVVGAEPEPRSSLQLPGRLVLDSRRLATSLDDAEWDACVVDLAAVRDVSLLGALARELRVTRLLLGYQLDPAVVLPMAVQPSGALAPLRTQAPAPAPAPLRAVPAQSAPTVPAAPAPVAAAAAPLTVPLALAAPTTGARYARV